MCSENDKGKELFPHHEQQPLCTSRLPYRQGRKLTAVKVYTINSESNHLLIFGVPSLNLQHETKSLFSKFGKLQKFVITTDHIAEQFTETYHAVYEKIQAARIAKKMLDTKNFYGGCLHISYAPELESIEETQKKILQRRKDVVFRLNNLKKEGNNKIDLEPQIDKVKIDNCDLNLTPNNVVTNVSNTKLDMGEINTIYFTDNKKRKRNIIEKMFKPCFETDSEIKKVSRADEIETRDKKIKKVVSNTDHIEIIDCTSVHKDTITNINDSLNYKEFGNEVVKNVPIKPLNVIKFSVNKKL